MVLHLEISDALEDAFIKRGLRSAFEIATEFFDYIRSKFLSNDAIKMQRAIDLLDFLMKNASSMKEHGHYIYHLIGRKRMMKTLARVARNLTRSGGVDPSMRVVGVTILGCIQVWGEAFSSGDRQELYSFYSVMKQLEEKYNVAWPFIPYDPDRCPSSSGTSHRKSVGLLLFRPRHKHRSPIAACPTTQAWRPPLAYDRRTKAAVRASTETSWSSTRAHPYPRAERSLSLTPGPYRPG